MTIQLNPQIPVYVEEKGLGYAILVTDYSQDHNRIWTVSFNDTGEIWDVPNQKIRLQWNWTMGRMPVL